MRRRSLASSRCTFKRWSLRRSISSMQRRSEISSSPRCKLNSSSFARKNNTYSRCLRRLKLKPWTCLQKLRPWTRESTSWRNNTSTETSKRRRTLIKCSSSPSATSLWVAWFRRLIIIALRCRRTTVTWCKSLTRSVRLFYNWNRSWTRSSRKSRRSSNKCLKCRRRAQAMALQPSLKPSIISARSSNVKNRYQDSPSPLQSSVKTLRLLASILIGKTLPTWLWRQRTYGISCTSCLSWWLQATPIAPAHRSTRWPRLWTCSKTVVGVARKIPTRSRVAWWHSVTKSKSSTRNIEPRRARRLLKPKMTREWYITLSSRVSFS